MADVLAVRAEYRAQQWAVLIQECKSSGMTIGMKRGTIQYPGSHSPRLLNPLTKRQREIYDLLAIPAPDCIG